MSEHFASLPLSPAMQANLDALEYREMGKLIEGGRLD